MICRLFSALLLALGLLACSSANGDLLGGVISDFQTGTDEGWAGGTIAVVPDSGPAGAGDFSLQLSNGGTAGNFAMFNTGVNGAISPLVTSIRTDIFRPAGIGAGEIRLVLFDTSNNRWTSTVAANVIDDGAWHTYVFSIAEADLTRVLGSGTYAFLTGNLERIMFRYDPGPPSAGGAALNGTMNFDNITAIPEPSSLFGLALVLGAAGFRRRRA